MPITFTDIFDVACEEERGRPVSLQRRGKVEGLTSTNPTDYINEILSSDQIPASGSTVTIRGQTLYLIRRSPKISNRDALGGATVDLFYERSEGASSETGEVPTLEVRGSLREVTRTKDRDDQPFVTQYTYPEDSKATFPNGKKKAGELVEAAGELRVLEPAVRLVGNINQATNNPGSVVLDFLGKVNSAAWQGQDPRTWLCVEAAAVLLDDTTIPKQWEFAFGFELDQSTWDSQTTLAYVDPQTNQIPADAEEGNGLTVVTYYEGANFNTSF